MIHCNIHTKIICKSKTTAQYRTLQQQDIRGVIIFKKHRSVTGETKIKQLQQLGLGGVGVRGLIVAMVRDQLTW